MLDLDHPAAFRLIVTIGGAHERVIAMGREKAATIRLKEDGMRTVSIYEIPCCRSVA